MRTRNTKNTATAAFSYNYEEEGIGHTTRDLLESSAAHIFDLGRRTTEQTFELGDHLSRAADLLADGRFDKWVKMRCGLSARSGRNYMAVFRNLGHVRDELVDLSVGATALFHLSSATTDQITAAIAFAEENGRLQVVDVKTILSGGEEGGDKAEKDDQFWMGGVGGLKVLIAAKIRDGVKAFIEHVVTICKAVEASLTRSRVIKEALAKEIQDIARVARQELESLALFLEPELDYGRNTKPTKFPKKTGWAEVNDTLYTLGCRWLAEVERNARLASASCASGARLGGVQRAEAGMAARHAECSGFRTGGSGRSGQRRRSSRCRAGNVGRGL